MRRRLIFGIAAATVFTLDDSLFAMALVFVVFLLLCTDDNAATFSALHQSFLAIIVDVMLQLR